MNFNTCTSILFNQLPSLRNKAVLLHQNSHQHIHFKSFIFFTFFIDLCILTSNICAIKSLKTVSSFCFIFSIRSISQLRNSCLSKSPSYERRKHPYTNSQCTCTCKHLFSCSENMCNKIFSHS